MHVARQRIISNRSLLQRAREADVPQYIQSKPFIPKLWIPYNYRFAKRVRDLVAPDDNPNLGDSQLEEPAAGSQKPGADDALEEGELLASEPQEQDEGQPEPIPQEAAEEAESPQIISRPPPPKPRKRGEDTRVQWLGDKVRTLILLEEQA